MLAGCNLQHADAVVLCNLHVSGISADANYSEVNRDLGEHKLFTTLSVLALKVKLSTQPVK